MNTTLRNFCIVFIVILSFSNCAKKGRPTGGAKDSIPPVIVKSDPENYTVNFEGDEIRIYFDEYIKLQDLQKNLIISPPMKNAPNITPLSTSKILKIKILDTLKENTTYSINFGKSIVDNNEANEFEYYKYVFSTGTYIDSLTLGGTVKDALKTQPASTTSVLLYEVTDTYTDSIPFLEKPTYITTTRDSTHAFELTNLKEGTYRLIALQEANSNYTFDPKRDYIGFEESYVTIPTDSSYTLSIFKEERPYKMDRGSHIGKHQILFGYEGPADSLTIEPISDVPETFVSKTIRDRKKDSLYYWYKPAFDIEQNDSLLFIARNKEQLDTLEVRMRDLFIDSLKIDKITSTNLLPRDTMKLGSTTPLVSFDAEKIQILDRDSLVIPASTYIDTVYNTASVLFPMKDDQRYAIEIMPDAFVDYFGATNLDTLSYSVKTKPISDYGTIRLGLQNAKEFPLIVELVSSKYEVLQQRYLTKNTSVSFDYVLPGNYYVRVIFDRNKNGKWDTGNFLSKVQPEKVIYYPSQLEIRANWDWNETFILTETNLGPPKKVAVPEE